MGAAGDAAQIAGVFDVVMPTMAQRPVRAKGRIRDTGIPFRVPSREEMPDRLTAELLGTEPEAWGLAALLTFLPRRERQRGSALRGRRSTNKTYRRGTAV